MNQRITLGLVQLDNFLHDAYVDPSGGVLVEEGSVRIRGHKEMGWLWMKRRRPFEVKLPNATLENMEDPAVIGPAPIEGIAELAGDRWRINWHTGASCDLLFGEKNVMAEVQM